MLPHDFRLLTLGGLSLRGGEGMPAADALRKQRRKLAVLVTLALERRPISRDILTEMFWGDQQEARARHSLSDALSHLRRVLGSHAITARGTDVVLDAGVPLAIDACELRAAAEAERWDAVIRLYGGPFLAGAHPGESVQLEAWIERERRKYELLFLRACEREYSTARSAACWERAHAVAQAWLDADPLSETAALALLSAIEAPDTDEAGARALQAYDALRLRLAREFDTAPGERVQARAAVLAERLPPPLEPAAPVAATPAVTEAHGAESDVGAHHDTPPAASSRIRVRRGAYWIAAGAATGAVALSLFLWLPTKEPPATASRAFRIAVLPFTVRGPDEYTYLQEGVVDLLSANLDGAGPFHTIDPQAVLNAAREMQAGVLSPDLAMRLGAGLFVRGDVVVAGSRLRISAGLFEPGPDGRRIAEAMVDGGPDDLFQLVDRLTAQLLGAAGSPVPPLGRLAAVTTSSLTALKAYLEGESEFREGLYASAFEAFRHATELDSSFALAHYRVAQAANWSVPPGWNWDSILTRSRVAAARAERLAPKARLLVETYAAWVSGAYDDAERGYRAVVRTYPDDVEAWYGLGEVLFHTNPVRGRPSIESGEAFERVLVLEPRNLAAMTHLLRVRLRERRIAEADSLIARLDVLEALPRTAEFHALRAFSHGTEVDRDRALAELRASGNDELVRTAAHRVAVYAGNLDGAARMLPLLLDEGLAADVRAHAHVWRAQLEVARGRWHAADRALDAAVHLDPVATEEGALLAVLPFAPDAPARAAAVESALLRLNPDMPATTYPWRAVYNGLHPTLRDYLLGLLELRRGDAEGTTRRAAALAARAAQSGGRDERELARGLAQSLLGHVAIAQGRSSEALARFDTARLKVSEGLLESQVGSQATERWARAELLFRTGRLQEALRWYATLAETSIDGLIYLAPAEARQAEICERLGDPGAAIVHYRRFLELWRDADPELAPWIAYARSRLQSLEAVAR